jgi:hypothetical protein
MRGSYNVANAVEMAASSSFQLQNAANSKEHGQNMKLTKNTKRKKKTFPDPFRYRDVTRNLYVIGPGATGMPDAQTHCTHTQNS